MVLDKTAVRFIAERSAKPPLYTLSPEKVRTLFNQDIHMEEVCIGGMKETDVEIPSEGGSIRGRIYSPAERGELPLFVYFHGGGWIFGNLDKAVGTCRILSSQLQAEVLSVDYRQAPEHPFPLPLEDCYSALNWAGRYAGREIIIGGEHSGGNLAAASALLARDRRGPAILAQVLICPALDFDFNTDSYLKYKEGFGLTREEMMWFAAQYAASPGDFYSHYAAPLLSADLTGLPPSLIFTAEYDVLKTDGLLFARRLVEAGIQVEYKCEEGMVNGFFSNQLFSRRIERTISRIAAFLATVKPDPAVNEC